MGCPSLLFSIPESGLRLELDDGADAVPLDAFEHGAVARPAVHGITYADRRVVELIDDLQPRAPGVGEDVPRRPI